MTKGNFCDTLYFMGILLKQCLPPFSNKDKASTTNKPKNRPRVIISHLGLFVKQFLRDYAKEDNIMKKPKKEDAHNEIENENPIIDEIDDDYIDDDNEEPSKDQYKNYYDDFYNCPTCGTTIDPNYRKLELR